MKRILAIATAAMLSSAALPALAQTGETDAGATTTAEGAVSTTTGQGDTQLQTGANVDAQVSGTTDTTMTGSINLSAEQQAQARSMLQGASPSDVDFAVDVGVTVPNTVTLAPLPPDFATLVPDYAGYQYFVLADGRIVIVQPETMKVVYILS
jgi:hypothetical protein